VFTFTATPATTTLLVCPSTYYEGYPWSVNAPPTTTFIVGLPINVITGATTSGGAIIPITIVSS
jgi:hypothetical protein